MGDAPQEPEPGQGEMEEGGWHPTNQNAAIMAEAAPRPHGQNGASFMEGGHLGQGYVAVAGQFDATSYQDLRPSFSGAYQLNAANQQELFQAAHSTFGRMTPPSQNDFVPHDHNNSEAIPAYSTIAAESAAQIITASTVDSSSLQQGYLVLDHDHVVAVQRVVSPADCTVSQSTLSVGPEAGDGQPTSTLLTMPTISTGQGQYVMQVAMPTFSSHGEVSTSSTDQEPSVSSLGAAFQSGMLGEVRKVEMESTTGECDTTQEDLDCQPHGTGSYLQAVGLSTHSVGMESEGLHTTMMAVSQPVTATVTSADLADHSTIHSGQLSSLRNAPLGAMGGGERVESSSGVGRVVDDDTISNALEEAIVSGSGVRENHIMNAHPQPYPSLAVPAPPVSHQIAEENQPSTSGTMMHSIQQQSISTRKSSRLAQFEREGQETRVARQQYEPRPYNVQELWCEECQMAYVEQCPTHRLNVVQDKVVLSRAWASLPALLQIFRLGSSTEDNAVMEMGVFARKQISKMTQFGPLVAEFVDTMDQVTNKNFMLMLEKTDGTRGYFEMQDENKCNWMMFMRPAATFAEQNVVAYQHGQGIFFTVIKTIEPRQELKVWYAAHYAEQMGQKAHEPTESDWALMDEQASRFQCRACSRRFRTSVALQRHLLEHEKEEGVKEEDEEGEESAEEEGGGRKGKRRMGAKSYLLKSKARQNGDASSSYQWKKKSTSIYINKTLKKYQKRGGTERMRQTFKSLYRRRGRGAGGLQEWVCRDCNLTFDNPNVLNIHTLTHAAVDVGLEEIRRLAGEPSPKQDSGEGISGGVLAQFAGDEAAGQSGNVAESDSSVVSVETCLVCPMCRVQFADKRDLIEHVAEHAKVPRPGRPERANRPFKCHMCWKGFTANETLQRHLLCHGEEDSKPLPCDFCNKRFMNNSALACHLKTHSEKKYYQCPLCHEGYDHMSALKQHLPRHADAEGRFTCPYCQKSFEDYYSIRKHMKTFHSEKQYVCPDCGRVFPRPDKLKLHMLRHTSHREFMCETCGRQFKRKDKLKEHMKRMHSTDREIKKPVRPHKDGAKKFIPRVPPSDYQRFIYKCNTCMLGFKRRGMLVNHLNKRHPNIKPESVHELNLPILKQQRDYFCQHCDKVYKSSSKRKSHILKNHPGAALPASGRKQVHGEQEETGGLLGSTFSQTIGSVTTMPHGCEFCHKQYASKAKLVQHQRKVHPEMVPAAQERRKPEIKNDYVIDISVTDENAVSTDRYEDVVVAAPSGITDGLPQADLLTQAMTELISTHTDFRPSGNIVHTPESIQLRSIVAGTGTTLLQVQPNGTLQPATIELSQLTQALSGHAQFPGQAPQLPAGTTLLATPANNSQQPQVITAQPLNISMVTGNAGSVIPVSIQPSNQTFVPRTWSSTIQTFQR